MQLLEFLGCLETPQLRGDFLEQHPMRLDPSIDREAFAHQRSVAEFLGLSQRTMERLRLEGRGPTFHKFGRRVLYRWHDVLTWADAQRRTSTSAKTLSTVGTKTQR